MPPPDIAVNEFNSAIGWNKIYNKKQINQLQAINPFGNGSRISHTLHLSRAELRKKKELSYQKEPLLHYILAV